MEQVRKKIISSKIYIHYEAINFENDFKNNTVNILSCYKPPKSNDQDFI